MSVAFDALMESGLAASRRDDVEAALQAWQSAAATEPESALPHFLMGAEYAQAQRLAEARRLRQRPSCSHGIETARYQLGLSSSPRAVRRLHTSPGEPCSAARRSPGAQLRPRLLGVGAR